MSKHYLQHYQCGADEFEAFIALPDTNGPHPAVLIVHEWWGRNDYVIGRAKQLAEQGYVGVAVDMYGNGKTADNPTEAQALMESVINNPDNIVQRFDAAMTLLPEIGQADAHRVAAIGYCFGGAVVLNMARAGKPLKAVCSFHGTLSPAFTMSADGFAGKIAVYNGADDPMVDADSIAAFKQEMQSAGVDYDFVNYPNTVHGFTNPLATARGEKYGIPLRYSAEADADAWSKMLALLSAVF